MLVSGVFPIWEIGKVTEGTLGEWEKARGQKKEKVVGRVIGREERY